MSAPINTIDVDPTASCTSSLIPLRTTSVVSQEVSLLHRVFPLTLWTIVLWSHFAYKREQYRVPLRGAGFQLVLPARPSRPESRGTDHPRQVPSPKVGRSRVEAESTPQVPCSGSRLAAVNSGCVQEGLDVLAVQPCRAQTFPIRLLLLHTLLVHLPSSGRQGTQGWLARASWWCDAVQVHPGSRAR